MRRTIVAVVMAVGLFGAGVAWAGTTPSPHRAKYHLVEDLYGYPGTLRLVQCDPNPDGRRRLWLVRDTGGLAVYSCVRP